MLYRLCKDTFVRAIGEFGYIYSQLTKHDRTYSESGQIFLKALSRTPQSMNEMLDKIVPQFDGATIETIKTDLTEFLNDLEKDRYVVSGNSEEELDQKEPHFSYTENPKTDTYNYMQNVDDVVKYADTTEILKTEYLKRPRIHTCQIELTNRCNERCIHCYIPHELKNDILPYEAIENILKQLHDMGTLSLTLSGGEALSHPDIIKILRRAREFDFSINILTNLTLLTPELIKVLQEVNPSIVQTSLYSVVPEEHDHITTIKGSFEKTAKAIDDLIDASIPVQISCPVMKSNFHSYKDVLRYAHKRKCKSQTDFIMMARYDFTTDNLKERLDEKETEEIIRDIIKYDKDYQALTNTPIQNKTREEIGKEPFCGVGRDGICIAANGIAYPCAGWQGMALGNVKTQSIEDIWEKSPNILKLRAITKANIPHCLDCVNRQFCSPCLVRNFNESNGDPLKVNPHFCKAAEINRKVVEEIKRQKK